jgi:hypothetical protein
MVCDCRILFAVAGVLEGLAFEVLMRIFISSNMKMNIFIGNSHTKKQTSAQKQRCRSIWTIDAAANYVRDAVYQ